MPTTAVNFSQITSCFAESDPTAKLSPRRKKNYSLHQILISHHVGLVFGKTSLRGI